VVADRLDGGRHVAAFEEQRPGRIDHRATGEPRAGLTTPALAWCVALDGIAHETIVSLSI